MDPPVFVTAPSPPADRLVKGLLAATIWLPVLVYRTAVYHGETVAILYREPKRDAIAILGWLTVAAFAWLVARRIDGARLRRSLANPVTVLLGLLVGYWCVTRVWVSVPANWSYEMSQVALLVLLVIVLLGWTTADRAVADVVEWALVAGAGTITVVGLIQWVRPELVPPAIDPFGEVGHPSLMGYKNPAALAVLAQLFLLVGLAAPADGARPRPRPGLTGLLGAEVLYLVSLQSRSAWLGLAAGAAVLAFLAWRAGDRRLLWSSVSVLAAGGVIAGAVFIANPGARARAWSVIELLRRPAAYLATDRGAYLAATLEMVQRHPLGVGLGDWQTHYPRFSTGGPSDNFDDRFQARRAHSDHVQMLGEAGWPGLALWAALLGALLLTAVSAAVRRHDRRGAVLAAQIAAVTAAMATDSFFETPYNKLQLFLLAYLVVARCRTPAARRGPAEPPPRGLRFAVAGLVTAAAVASITLAVETERKLVEASTTTALYRVVTETPMAPDDAVRLLEDATALGDRWAGRPGHWKSMFRDLLALAGCEARLGRTDGARLRVAESLRLQPFNPQALLLMARLCDDPAEAEIWREAADRVRSSVRTGRAPGGSAGGGRGAAVAH